MTEFEKELDRNVELIGGNIKIATFTQNIELSNCNLSFENRKALDSINFIVNRMETISFVGESGSGKTTLLNVIAGLYRVDEGNVMIDGINFKDLDIKSFHKRIGYIIQEPIIFNDTIYNNVTFWAEKTPNNIDRFKKALSRASLSDFVSTLSNGMDTFIENGGINLSGGQKQRISIARELFKEIDILIMDEATSALDSETEKSIKESFDNLKGRMTILIVAHRLSTVKNSDRIVLMKGGRIMGIGNYNELLNNPMFSSMVENQKI
jgi:subfamily B ATP-binding cassette protein MsbA